MLTPLSQSAWTPALADHLLFRAGFGGTPTERAALYELGRSSGVAAAVASLTDVTEDWAALPIPSWVSSSSEVITRYDTQQTATRYEFVRFWMRHLTEGRPLAGKLLKFFVDHLPIEWGMIAPDYARFPYFHGWLDCLRRRCGGAVGGDNERDSFRALIRDIGWNPGMMRMLDLWNSRRGRVNENYGRELLELFTLGVDGGYTENDVMACAAALTGRLLRNTFPYESYLTSTANDIDRTAKTLLGQSIASITTGEQGDRVLEIIFGNLNCARHTAWKLWRYFVSPNPSAALLDYLATQLRDVHQYRLRPFLKEIFLSEQFYDAAHRGRMIKDPLDWLVMNTKLLECPLPGMATCHLMSLQLGHDIHFPPNIAGWPEPVGEGNQWLATGVMMRRLNFPGYWSHGHYQVLNNNNTLQTYGEHQNLPVANLDAIAPPELRSAATFPILVERLAERLLPFHPLRPAQTRTLLARWQKVEREAGSTEATRDLLRVFLSLPEYQLS